MKTPEKTNSLPKKKKDDATTTTEKSETLQHSLSSWTTSDLEQWRASMQETHTSGRNLSYTWRMQQLHAMRRMITEHKELFLQALHQDLGKERTEATISELDQVLTEIAYFERNLSSLMKARHVPSHGGFVPAFTWIEQRPLLGPAVLIIGPSNYPVNLCCHPAVGSLAAGNPTLIKPSELCPAVALALAQLVPQYFDPGALRVALGPVEQTQRLLSYPWGKILFTGSSRVGKLVAQQAAKTLTPTILELGGKCPCYIDDDETSQPWFVDWKLAASRIIWAKLLNTGQTCAAVDYLIVPEHVLPKIVPHLKDAVRQQFGPDPSQGELGRIVQSKPHAQRMVDMIQELETMSPKQQQQQQKDANNDKHKLEVIMGGSALCRVEERYICPTLVINPPLDSRVMQEEIFGPILPILTVKNRSEAIQLMQKVESTVGTPLCLYVFTNSNQVLSEITTVCRTGSVVRNDCLVHLVSNQIPFGGIGQSGYGNYHGSYSFQSFSQELPIMYRPLVPGSDLNGTRCHPFQNHGFKRELLLAAVHFPNIPVLLRRSYGPAWKWGIGILSLALILANFCPASAKAFWLQPILSVMATGLERVAEYLKGDSSSEIGERDLLQ